MQKNFNIVWPKVSNNKELKNKNSSFKKFTPLIKNTIKRSSEIRGQIIVIKLSALIINQDNLLDNFVENVQLLSICGAKIYIIHDYANLIDETLMMFGIDEKIISDLKVADHKSTQIIEMVVSGYINKLIVSKLCRIGMYAVGISGKDGNLIQAKKTNMKVKRQVNCERVIDIGFVSEPMIINPEILLSFENTEIIPVISPIASDERGNTHLLDVDLTASIIASALDADHLILPYDHEQYLTKNTATNIKTLQKYLLEKNSIASDPKTTQDHFELFEGAGSHVHFVNSLLFDGILLSLFSNKE